MAVAGQLSFCRSHILFPGMKTQHFLQGDIPLFPQRPQDLGGAPLLPGSGVGQ